MAPKPKAQGKPSTPVSRYTEAVGRRKTAIARVRLTKGNKGVFTVGEKKLEEYFQLPQLQVLARSPLEKLDMMDYGVTAKVVGGGIAAQAEAVRLGVARALVMIDEDLKKKLRAFGFLTRDPRAVERKKYGLKKARRSPQWAKR